MSLFVGAYLATNLLLFIFNPYSSKWHYQDHNPVVIQTEQPQDQDLTVSDIEKILNEIDLAYNAREPSRLENIQDWGLTATQLVFLPSTIALVVKSFMGYMGPANQAQRDFTISVKKRYNHLVRLGKEKGMTKIGFYFVEEPSLVKQNGKSY